MEQNAEVIFVPEDYTQKHSSVAEMFPDYDLTAVYKEYGHTSSEWLINWIVENMSTLPKKQQGVKRKAETSMLAESFDQVESDEVSSDEEENTGNLLRDVMFGEMLTALKSELHKTPALDVDKHGQPRELLLDMFPTGSN
uniref:Uncharacterized protein n=1 Tax=Ditylenchus dipsaci TaxID=166011 RepID=A0A915EE98_9BILA